MLVLRFKQFVRVGSEHLHLLSHLSSPSYAFCPAFATVLYQSYVMLGECICFLCLNTRDLPTLLTWLAFWCQVVLNGVNGPYLIIPHSLFHGHLGQFQLLANMNSTVIRILHYPFVDMNSILPWMPA